MHLHIQCHASNQLILIIYNINVVSVRFLFIDLNKTLKKLLFVKTFLSSNPTIIDGNFIIYEDDGVLNYL